MNAPKLRDLASLLEARWRPTKLPGRAWLTMSPRDKLHVMQPMRAFLRGSLVEHPSQRPRPKPRRPVCLLFSNLDSWDILRFTILILIYPWKLTLQAVTPEEQEKKDFQKDLSQWCTQESMESFHYRFQGLVFLIGLRISQLGNKARLAAQALTKHGITNQEAITNVHIYIYIHSKKSTYPLFAWTSLGGWSNLWLLQSLPN